MAQLNLKLKEERLRALRRLAAQRRTPVAWLLKDYVDYLLAGGPPVLPPAIAEVQTEDLAEVAERGGAFDWLRDEPELYSLEDGTPL